MTVHRRAWTITACIFAISGVFAASASAQTTTNYHPDAESRTFATRDGGWIGSTSFDNGLCVAGVTCPATDEAFVANGGARRTRGRVPARHRSAGRQASPRWLDVTETSPSFVYQGAAGKTPETVSWPSIGASTRAPCWLILDSATYSVVLSDLTSATSLPVINQVAITEQQTWASVPSVAIDPSQLKIGDRYQIQISTDLDFPVSGSPRGRRSTTTTSFCGPYPPTAGRRRRRRRKRRQWRQWRKWTRRQRCHRGCACWRSRLRSASGQQAPRQGALPEERARQVQVQPRRTRVVQALGQGHLEAAREGEAGSEEGCRREGHRPIYLSKVQRMKKLRFTGKVRSGSTTAKFNKRLKLKHGLSRGTGIGR